ncbi:MAG: PKD domain-containing protein [Candidatus Thermoplasmatota archaeon]|jgi:hypothetical protein|nr:PKD domain-containing protein [Candidatus Thermoplasmatota archaeon]
MQSGIDDWLHDYGLSNKFQENTYNKPTFSFIEGEIERSQDVILLMGYYDVILGNKIPDQQQPLFNYNDNLNIATWWDYQSFVPSINRLDVIQIFLVSNGPPCDVQINVYNAPQGSPIGTSTLNPGLLQSPMWIQFHFDPYIPLTPENTYYFDVRELQTPDEFHYEWFLFNSPIAYPNGQGWLDGSPTPGVGSFDWTFITEYYNPQSTRIGGHYVTCAGVNSQELMIAFSDPCWDIQNPTQDYTKHNDPQYVSHDIYEVGIGCPVPGYDYKWWIKDYAADCDYTLVEQAVVICPINSPPNKPVKPSGPAKGKVGTTYTYTSSTTDPDGDQIWYWFDWGDGSNSGWLGPYVAGATANASHKWTTKGTYNVKAKAKDVYGAESEWSEALSVSMPRRYAVFRFLERFPRVSQILKHFFNK